MVKIPKRFMNGIANHHYTRNLPVVRQHPAQNNCNILKRHFVVSIGYCVLEYVHAINFWIFIIALKLRHANPSKLNEHMVKPMLTHRYDFRSEFMYYTKCLWEYCCIWVLLFAIVNEIIIITKINFQHKYRLLYGWRLPKLGKAGTSTWT